MLLGLNIFAQSNLIGTVIDAQTKEPLVGASVYDAKTKKGVTTDLSGKFSLSGENGTELQFSYMGYQTQNQVVTAGSEVVIALKSEVVMIKGAEIITDIAVARKTPVATSTITPMIIEERLGTQEFPEILKSTPGVYATKQGGGFGDSRINLRGFESANVAVMINGVPMNDMEWGGVYWSNWAGLADVTRTMQVQRGLGASKVAAPSVGGSINIVTKSTDAVKGGSASYQIGSGGQNKVSFSTSTGLMDNGWAITLLGAKTWGDGYVLGTNYEGYSYFANISKQIGKNHIISLTGFGAPQTHFQRSTYDKLPAEQWYTFQDGIKYNATYGHDYNGEQHSAYYNYYHKPQISLNHYWDINEKSTLATSLYVSIGRGGGYAAEGTSKADVYGANNGVLNTKYRTAEMYFDYGALALDNAANPNGSQAFARTSTNEHNWYGLLSTYENKISDEISIQAGFDGRYYEGIHQAFIADLMGGAFAFDPYRKNVIAANNPEHNNTDLAWVNQKLKVGDAIYRDNTSYVLQAGLFGQAEYSKDDFNAFVSGSFNNNTYWKYDRYYFNNQRSESVNKWGWVAKGGANYNLNDNFNVFGNIGYISRVPFMSSVFTNLTVSNDINKAAVNEKVFSKELGVGYKSKYLVANLNAYHTNWNDKATTRNIDNTNPSKGTINLTGVDALHMGVELEVTARPVKNLEIRGMLSLGDWQWKSSPTGYCYNAQGQPVDNRGNVVEDGSADHAWLTLKQEGIHVGGSAQTTAALGVSYKLFNSIKLGLDWNYYGRNYSSYSIPSSSTGEVKISEPWRIPSASLFDAYASYSFKIGNFDAILTGNCNNLLNLHYVLDADNVISGNVYTPNVLYAFGRTASVSLKIKF
ncbi:TonB-dependent receptor [Bacteroidia bacterium]|nr:TonB-dependent receptor [Bacteroidia bacterium]